MATLVWLSNEASEVSGYKKAYVGFRSPNASTTVSTAATTTNASGTNIPITSTSGGSAVKFITQPFENAVTISGSIVFNYWALEDNAAANAAMGLTLAEYTTSEQSVFVTTSYGTELTTSATEVQRSRQPAAVGEVDGGTYTSTTIDAGNRLVIIPIVTNVGTMGGGRLVTLDYNGSTAGADGDSFIILNETVQVDGSQFGDGQTSAIDGGPSVMQYGDFVRQLDPVVQEIASNDASWLALKDELNAQADVQTA